MATRYDSLIVFLAIAFTVTPALSRPAYADDLQRIRTESSLLRATIAEAATRSPAFRGLVRRIEQSDLIVHLTCEHFDTGMLNGRTMLASVGPDVRYARVQIRCQQLTPSLVAIIAHEFQHVVEIASAPAVVDRRSFGQLFAKIGFATCHSPSSEQFETMAALEVGELVRREYIHPAEMGTRATH